jgi:hypothetical protein
VNTNRFSTEDQRQTLKTMWRLLMRRTALSLDDIAADITRLSKPCLSKAGSAQDDYFAPMDAVLDLELAAGDPLVTRAMARAQGYRLVAMDAAQSALDLMQATAQYAALLGDWSKDLVAAQADGRMTASEREKLINDVRALITHGQQLHDTLAGHGGGAAQVADFAKARTKTQGGDGHA